MNAPRKNAEIPLDPPRDVPLSKAFVPPSITPDKLCSGASYTYHSIIPAKIRSEKSVPCVLGVDEAGRGPVLGPMVYAVAYIPAESAHLLRERQFDDSKKLTASMRSSLLKATCTPGSDLYETLGWSTTLLSPQDISAGMLRPAGTGAYNLNAQAHDTTAELIRAVINMGVNVTEIYVDTVGVASTYQAKLQKLFPSASVIVAKKADSLYPIVSAASVCAKVTRDAAIELFAEIEKSKAELGSGYPGDEKTKAWLRESLDPVFGWDGRIVRFSWRTARDMMEAKKARVVEVEWPEDVDDSEQPIVNCFRGDEEQGVGSWYGKPVSTDEI